ncbi:glycosyltransferase family 4 protein [Nocardia sp. NBC_01499]|uniref:glycosyltransferase family 4 protein n=1 Tax=Nocardia sp. NBC_01499 TaxID=2903597 RepID=UPI00386D7347
MEAAKWITALRDIGAEVTRAAGHFDDHEDADVTIRGMWAAVPGGTPPDVDTSAIDRLCSGHDLLILDNAATLPSAPEASRAWETAAIAHAIPTIVRHHDPPWQTKSMRPDLDGSVPVTNSRFLHVVINQQTLHEYAQRWPELDSIGALRVVTNRVDTIRLSKGGDRERTRQLLGVDPDSVLLVHPARAVARKNIPRAVEFANTLSTLVDQPVRYWLTDPSVVSQEDPIAEALKDAPGLLRGHVPDQADMYAAADVVLLPSTWEGWGLPVVEAAAARRLIVAGPYPILDEIRAAVPVIFDPSQAPQVASILRSRGKLDELLHHNAIAAAKHFDLAELPSILTELATDAHRLAKS